MDYDYLHGCYFSGCAGDLVKERIYLKRKAEHYLSAQNAGNGKKAI